MSAVTDSTRKRPLAVEWHEAVWAPAIIVRRAFRRGAIKPLFVKGLLKPAAPRHHLTKTMKPKLFFSRRSRAGFTLVELLVVIAIIAILASMTLAVIGKVGGKAKQKKAQIEAQAIVTAIEGYDSAYGRFPISTALQNALNNIGWKDDYTYGGSLFINQATSLSSLYTSNNSEVVAILMNLKAFPDGTPTINAGNQKNPHSTVFLTAMTTGDSTLPGVGPDLVYRDPWGNPYIISMDLNYDDQCRDGFYGLQGVSQNPPPGPYVQTGFNGLSNPNNPAPTLPLQNDFRFHGKVMVWSAGPDKKIDTGTPANTGVNKDNILSWQ